ncbi:MAG: DUF2059 domain-containing protein [Bdellovibrionales bacterium]|nr:DUF2059 domain-containing protein [Bdellovibrionales bacterium]
MTKITTLLVLSLFLISDSISAAPQAADGKGDGDVHAAVNLMRAMNMKKNWAATLDVVSNQISQGQPELKEPVKKFYEKVMSYDSIETKVAKIYAKHYTNQELADLLAFYSTPTGKKSLEIMPVVMQESMKVGQDAVTEHQDELREVFQKAAAKKQRK